MAHLLQVGVGSGGMPVIDMLARDPRVTHVTLIEPDVYKPHNVDRHLFPHSAVGELKAVLAEDWLKARRPDLVVRTLVCDLLDPAQQAAIDDAATEADLGILAADNESAKFHWDALMRRHGKPWTLGEVLSGGIGGFVHWFRPGGPCYGCVASHLQRSVAIEKPAAPDYSQPGGPVAETTIPASRASIQATASLHALVTQGLLADPAGYDPGFTSLLLTLQRVPDVFAEAFRPYRFRVARSADCLICRPNLASSSPEELDVALDQRWRDWAMHDFWPLTRAKPQPTALHFHYEKAGLTPADQPIPWNAEAVVVEAALRLPTPVMRRKTDYFLRLPGREPIPADNLRRAEADDRYRLHFRFTPPGQTTTAELLYRTNSLGQLTLPFLSREDFLAGLRVLMPTLFVRLGEASVACQTFVANQCRGLLASAILTSPHGLVPVLDLDFQVDFRCERTETVHRVSANLCSSQLNGRQALVAVAPRRHPRRIGNYLATWMLGDQPLASQRIRGISQKTFHRSLRISDTRFVIQSGGKVQIGRQPPAPGVERAGPCFLVSSGEPGMAGLVELTIAAQVSGAVRPPILQKIETLITDGPTPVMPGTLDAAELMGVHGFELSLPGRSLGILSLNPAPTATFTTEGGFKPPPDFTWSPAAEDEMNERLQRLFNAGGGTA